MQFENSLMLIALVSLIPVIILYLIKPKPKDIKIPSLMFIMYTEKKEKKYHSVLRKLVSDPLLIIQLFALAALSIAVAGPYIMAAVSGVDHTVIVLDASASMQAKDVEPSRFAQAVNLAKDYTEGRVSVIMAMSSPAVVLEKGGGKEAKLVLDQLTPRATPTNLGDAILLARGLIGKEKGRIVVISDFADWAEFSPLIAEKIVASKNLEVKYVQVGSKGAGSNIGIISSSFKDGEFSFVVRNFKTEQQRATVNVYLNDRFQSSEVKTIPVFGSDFFTLTNVTRTEGVLKIALLPEDDFPLDNAAYISIPGVRDRSVLVVSQNKTSSVHIAISVVPNTKLENSTPPVIPKFTQNIVVISNVKQNSLLPGMISDLKTYVEGGGTLVVLASQELPKLGIGDLLPVEVSGLSNNSSKIVIETDSEFRDVDFGWVNNYLSARAKNSSLVIASTARDSTPIFAYWNIGLGKVIYLGTSNAPGDAIQGDFYTRATYPIFWLKLIDWVSATADPKDFNYKTGEVISFPAEQQVTFNPISKPETVTMVTKNLLLDEVGIYSIGERKISANLLDERESSISISDISSDAAAVLKEQQLAGDKPREEKLNFEPYLLIIAFLLVVLELIYLRSRGEL